ncbi:MAG: hypothetical protein ACE3L7_12420 [Candidatus Pristimantibacillus sp.]
MLKLLKYDWKRNANGLLATAVILLVVEVMLIVIGQWNNWHEGLIYGLGVAGLIGAGVKLFITMWKTYDTNITAYNRRLLPVSALSTIFSPLLFGVAAFLVLLIAIFVHGMIFSSIIDLDLNIYSILKEESLGILKGLLIITMMMLYFSVTVLFSITVARSIRSKSGGIWLGIGVFFLIHVVVTWLEDILFPSSSSSIVEGSATIDDTSMDYFLTYDLGINDLQMWGTTLIEAGVAALLVYLMIKLLNKKLQ